MDIINCTICDKLINEETPAFSCSLCQKWYHHECNLPLIPNVDHVGSCLNCNCSLFPFSICYDLNDESFRFNYFHPNFSDIASIQKLNRENTDYNFDAIDCNYYGCDDFNFAFSNSSSYISFLHLNISSLSKHLDVFNNLLNTLDHKFKVLGITETRLKDSPSIPHNLDIDGYSTPLLTYTKANAGGTALYISNDIKYTPRKDLNQILYSERELESTFCELIFEKQDNVIVGCIYKHPTMNTEIFTEDFFNRLLQKVNRENKRLVLLGDFNINLLDCGTHMPVNNFIDTLQSNFLLPSISLPTRITDRSKTLIDNIYFTPTKFKPSSGNLLVGISDHLPQFLVFQNFKTNTTKEPRYYRTWKKFDEEKFTTDFHQTDWHRLLATELNDPDKSFENFYNRLNGLIDLHAPLKKLSKKQIKKGGKPWITKGLKISIEKREELLKLYAKEKDQIAKTELYSRFKYYKNQIVKLCRKSKNLHFKKYFDSNIKNSKNIWKGINEIIKSKRSYNTTSISLNINGTITSDPKLTSEELNKHFATIAGKIRQSMPTNDNHENFAETLRDPPVNSLFFQPIRSNEIVKIINSLKPKADGPFSIPTKILKTVLNEISEILASIFNLSIQTGKFISLLKLAKVIPIYKNKGSPHDANNYRPISLLSNIDKIFEKLIKFRLVNYLEENNVIFKNQFGFRSKHSTTHALINLTEKIRANIDKGLYSCGVFIDLQKAFDTVDHNILLSKLNHYGVRGVSNLWFRSYLSNRQQFVSISGYSSESRPVEFGVPQGSVLGPLLFLLYINDLPNAIENSQTNLFADDTCLLSCDSDLKSLELKVNTDLVKLSAWLLANKISLNAMKTEVLLFRSRNKSVTYNIQLKIDNHQLKLSSHVKYLGILLDEFLTWNYHFDFLSSKLSKANGILAKLRHFIPLTLLKTLYYALFHSHLSYASIVWGQTITQNSRIGKLQKKCLRILTFSNFNAESSPLFTNLEIPTLPNSIFICNIRLVHETLNNHSPLALQNTLDFKVISHHHHTRNRNLKLLERRKAKTLNFGLKSIQYQSLLKWNQLLLQSKEDLSSLSP